MSKYRINGFEQIKSFYSWVFNNSELVRPSHISLYLFLWNQGNRANWVEWFKCPYDLAMQGACIGSKGTYYRALDDLQRFKLIEYQKGLNNYKAPKIKLLCLYDNEQLTKQVTVPLSEQVTVPLSGLLTGNIYNNLKQYNKEQITTIKKAVDEVYNSFLKEPNHSNIDDFKQQLATNLIEHQQWLDSCYMTLKLRKNSISDLIDKYKQHLIGYSKPEKEDMQDFKTHFRSWLLMEDKYNRLGDYKRK